MFSITADKNVADWRQRSLLWLSIVIPIIALHLAFGDSLSRLVAVWNGQEEYSYGYLVPFIAAFLVYQKKDVLAQLSPRGSWSGLVICLIAGILLFLGDLSAVHTIVQYAFIVMIAGLIVTQLGWRGLRELWAALALLFFMIPLPGFIYVGLSSQLQLVSSEIGVWIIQLFGISVYLEGNVIDLGQMKLQVIDACSGLRYLFPLMTFGFILAYYFKAEYWKKLFVFLSTIPITILMNSIRIGIIGVMVEYWGKGMAEGFLHDFEGWAIFMSCVLILLLEISILAKLGGNSRSLMSVLPISMPGKASGNKCLHIFRFSAPYYSAVSFLLIIAVTMQLSPEREELLPLRKNFSEFPLNISGWKGQLQPLDPMYIDALNFDDYIMVNYSGSDRSSINLYIAYYKRQNKDKVPHSPRACIPGGGWQIVKLTRRAVGTKARHVVLNVGNKTREDGALYVNSVVIEKNQEKQLVYYWFQQRGRILTNEYLVKWYIFWDAMTKHRTDGAMVRLVTHVGKEETLEDAHQRLQQLIAKIYPKLGNYIPA